MIDSPEWLETNGIGGYAIGTVAGIRTRRYHGLLVAATDIPLGRQLLLAGIIEFVMIGDRKYALSSNRFADSVDPDGCIQLRGFRLDPFPIWTYEFDGYTIERELFMIHGSNATMIRWNVVSCPADLPISLELLPLVAFRDHHHLTKKDGERKFRVAADTHSLEITALDLDTPLVISAAEFEHEITGHWYDNFELDIEQERGFDHVEELFQPIKISLQIESTASVILATERFDTSRCDEFRQAEISRRARIVAKAKCKSPAERTLALAADQFIVRRGDGSTIIAGYPWFSDWGRDTMIAMPGLALETGRPEIARAIIDVYAIYISEGMIPNRFPDEGEVPDYNTVDATLWYFEAIRAYIAATADLSVLRGGLYDKLVSIVEKHINGTRFGIRVDTDGLLNSGVLGTQLTWMDAKIGDIVITPRTGKAVEIQALWFNALMSLANMAELLDKSNDAAKYTEMAAIAKESFTGQFWNAGRGCLYDVISSDGNDASLRPNQIFAVSLHYPLLAGDMARAVVDAVERELLTPFGLRTLASGELDYHGTYAGTPFERDSAYHQGTVWAWLLGPFARAYDRTHSKAESAEMLAEMSEWIEKHLAQASLGTASEIFDANPPHKPRGCPAQAWSVAEYLRILRMIGR